MQQDGGKRGGGKHQYKQVVISSVQHPICTLPPRGVQELQRGRCNRDVSHFHEIPACRCHRGGISRRPHHHTLLSCYPPSSLQRSHRALFALPMCLNRGSVSDSCIKACLLASSCTYQVSLLLFPACVLKACSKLGSSECGYFIKRKICNYG